MGCCSSRDSIPPQKKENPTGVLRDPPLLAQRLLGARGDRIQLDDIIVGAVGLLWVFGVNRTDFGGASADWISNGFTGLPAEDLAGSAVEFGSHADEPGGRVNAEVGALGEVPAQQAVGVLVRSPLPGARSLVAVILHACGQRYRIVTRRGGARPLGGRASSDVGEKH